MAIMTTTDMFHSVGDATSSNEMMETTSTPHIPAHCQFLPHQGIEDFEGLKGEPHNTDDLFYDSNSGAYQQRWASVQSEKMSSVKKRGGGSWLLGFARIRTANEASSDESDVECDSVDSNIADTGMPGLVRSNSNGSLESYESSQSRRSSDSSSSSSSKKGVSFNEAVRVLPIPHSSAYSVVQRKKMYSTSQEVRANKIRNKKEYRYDGYDWRNATEEWEMSVCMVTGELVHPAHAHT